MLVAEKTAVTKSICLVEKISFKNVAGSCLPLQVPLWCPGKWHSTLSFSAAVVLCKWYMTAAVCTTVSLLSPALLSQTDALSEAELFVKLIRLRT